MKTIYALLLIITLSITTQAQVVISQVYGGGGNTGAVFTNDFIELFNRGTQPQNLSGWSVQYASASGTTWFVTRLPDFTLQPGQYFLIQQAAGANSVAALPTPDLNALTCECTYNTSNPPVVSTTGIAMSGTNGKVILVNSIVAETTANPTGSQIIDKLGFGSANGFEGGSAVGVLSNSTAALRNNSGCTDTDSNSADFTVGTPSPRNSSTPVNSCTLSTNDNQILGLKVYPNPTKDFLNITTDSNLTKQVQVYDMIGKEVINTEIQNQLNVSSLTSGMYLVRITEEGKTSTEKIVIN